MQKLEQQFIYILESHKWLGAQPLMLESLLVIRYEDPYLI